MQVNNEYWSTFKSFQSNKSVRASINPWILTFLKVNPNNILQQFKGLSVKDQNCRKTRFNDPGLKGTLHWVLVSVYTTLSQIKAY